jgi:hypothetical protein
MYSEKAEVNEEQRSDNDQCVEGADDKHEKRGDIGRCVQATDNNEVRKKR